MYDDEDEDSLNDVELPVHDVPHPTGKEPSSIFWTLVAFMFSLVLLRFIMPALVEEVHYAIERGKQRARYDIADDKLSKVSLSDLSAVSKMVTQRIAPSVVHIDTSRESGESADGQGSGVIISSDGQIITNHHVIENAETVEVTLADDRSFTAKVVGVDPNSDLALLQLKGVSDLIPAEWGSSDELETGSMVWAFGSPFGLSKSATFGIISAKERRSVDARRASTFKDPQVYIQSDATVHSGNSGGPLVNAQGQVVGINTAIIGPSFLGVSFSIPSDRAQEVYDTVLTSDQRSSGWLGVLLTTPKDGEFGATIDGFVMPSDSPGKQAGLELGDVVVMWDGQKVFSVNELKRLVRISHVGDTIGLVVRRGELERELEITIGSRPLQF